GRRVLHRCGVLAGRTSRIEGASLPILLFPANQSGAPGPSAARWRTTSRLRASARGRSTRLEPQFETKDLAVSSVATKSSRTPLLGGDGCAEEAERSTTRASLEHVVCF